MGRRLSRLLARLKSNFDKERIISRYVVHATTSFKSFVGLTERLFQHVVLVGGFGASDWLFKRLQVELGSQGLKVVRPELYVYVFSPAPTLSLQLATDSDIAETKPSQMEPSHSISLASSKLASRNIAMGRCRMSSSTSKIRIIGRGRGRF